MRYSRIVRALDAFLRPPSGLSYQRVKRALHTSQPERLVCRDAQHDVVERFVDAHVTGRRPASLYISGAPGTGKTVVMAQIVNKWTVRVVTLYSFVLSYICFLYHYFFWPIFFWPIFFPEFVFPNFFSSRNFFFIF